MSASTLVLLSRRQFWVSIAIGIILWFLAAMILQVIGPLGALDGGWRAVTFLAVIPGTVPVALLLRRIVQLRGQQLVLAFGAGTMSAALCDGIALSWFPMLYGSGDAQIAASGATILWGVGVGLALAFAFARE